MKTDPCLYPNGLVFSGQKQTSHVKYIAVVQASNFWRKNLANIKSQIKRNRQNEKRRLRNRNFRGAARTAVNQARAALGANAPDSREAVLRAISMLDKAAEQGVIHPNNAARRKGRLMKRLAGLDGQPAPAKIEEPKKKK